MPPGSDVKDLERFRELAAELAERDAGLAGGIEAARVCAESLRARALDRLGAFRTECERNGVPHLARVVIGPAEPDEKHVDAVQVRVTRGRWEVVCVAKSRGEATLVGPYKRGKEETPCKSYAFDSDALGPALDDLLLLLLRQASERK